MKARVLALFVGLLVLATTISAADESRTETRFGIRAGFGIDPDQIVIGGQSILGKAGKIFKIGASLDAGFGDNVTTFCLNGDLMLDFPVPNSRGTFYALAGPTFMLYDPKYGDGDSEIGLSIGGGFRHGLKGGSKLLTLELRAGIGDIPDGRILAGILF